MIVGLIIECYFLQGGLIISIFGLIGLWTGIRWNAAGRDRL